MLIIKNSSKVAEVQGGSVVSPKGYKADGVHAGLRYKKKDVGVIVSDVPASSAAVYTLNAFQAAPLQVTQESIAKEGKLQAIVVNSAFANACTGKQGVVDAYEMRKQCAEAFSFAEHLVAVASTGVIGECMPMEKIIHGIQQLRPTNDTDGAVSFQQAILTTDTVMKTACYQTHINGHAVTIGGAAKGSGMIHPNMATMLAFVTTDANIESTYLSMALKQITNKTFNQITVDGDTSTNDMVIVMANGLAGNESLTPSHSEWDDFVEALQQTCESLAKQIARDGEGATKLVEVRVVGAATDEDAAKIAKSIVGSSLVKSAIYGTDANWGRIICAIGYSGVQLDTSYIDIALGPIKILEGSEPLPFSEEQATEYLQNSDVTIDVQLHQGSGEGCAWGCDLTYDYVKINASYRT
ncbi:bifunctional ornithine acetyltransferase/N-acetylglutamate synthase [Bacillus sp. HMF5848]|uniref:bifunctional ornithine acetyltransferase/N-acetylglutamate synthase n=1 Tax=Bacillus sp. HMF5848 TaxID=2495421 RepID=UPI000F7A53C5|nr:bifunctional ornithine acetyltransferase/N-acetylglutamate synthase [Bacillus sp. HMF5848]RSK26450.1 bifunctional ornithine acetyltransferase/N-acetylglutamate synthase [Bacillus sp. HMF5848]